jgi:hypothetical protein
LISNRAILGATEVSRDQCCAYISSKPKFSSRYFDWRRIDPE